MCCALPGEQLVGDILFECFKPTMVFEDSQCPLKLYYNRGDMANTDTPCVGSGDAWMD